jgi:hypothetical protein
MDVLKMLKELREQREQLDEVIAALARLGSGQRRRPGRPPAWMKSVKDGGVKRRGRPRGSKNKTKAEDRP